jgi:hypothetical protein
MKEQTHDPHTVVKCSEMRRTLTFLTSEMSLKTNTWNRNRTYWHDTQTSQ